MNRRILPNNIPSQGPDLYGQLPQQQAQQSSQNPQEPPGGGGPPNTPAKPTYAKRGKITIVACVPCRKRKTKCDGQRPSCTQCQTRDGVCSYDMTDEQRKLTYLRDNVEQLQDRSNALESLLHTFQSASDEEAAEVFRRLRSGTAVHVVAEQVQAGHLLSGVGMSSSSFPASVQPDSSGQPSSRDLSRLEQFDTLFNTLVKADPTDASHIIQKLRSGTPISSVLGAARRGSLTPQPLITDSQTPESSAGLEGDFSRQDQTFGMVKGADVSGTHASLGRGREFIISQIRHPWTQVTQDVELVEHLITEYFIWQHCFFQSFPEKLFRADMAAGRTKYCSSMLVNAICAAGCFLSNREEARNDEVNGQNLISRFFDEATRLLAESTSSSITATATLYLLSYVEGTRGNLTSLWMYSGRSCLMAIDLNLHLRQNRSNSSGSDEEEQEIEREEKARSHAFWGCMHVDQTTSFTLGRLPNININGITVQLPPVSDDDDEEAWEAFDGSPTQPGARSTTFRQCSELSKILNSTLMMFFAPSVPLTGTLLLEEYQKYLDWYRDLPGIVAKTNGAPPHVLCLHLYYHTAVLLLFRPFLKAKMTQSTVVPREVCRQSANAISDIVALHQSQYGISGFYMFQVHCLLTACTIHIVNVPSISSTNYLTRACNMLQELIPRNEWARSSLGILRGLVEKWRLVLPLETEEALYRDLNNSDASEDHTGGAALEVIPAADSASQWPRGPDPLTTRSKGMYQGGNTIVPLDPRLSQDEPGQSQQPMGVAQEDAAAGATPVKRASGSSQSSTTEPPAAGTQKRRRMMPVHPFDKGSNLVPISTSGQGQGQQAGQQDQQQANQAGSPTNYLYSPLKGQAAPMLGGPVHGSAPPAASTGTSRGGGNQQGSRGKKRQKSGEEQGQNSVEGITFNDDWRDPFMGFLGQEE